MPPKMVWLATVVRVAITPVFLGALFLWLQPERSARDMAAGAGLALLGAIHLVFWSQPWPVRQSRAVTAAVAMVLTNLALLHGLALSQPLLWLYPASSARGYARPWHSSRSG